MTAGRLLREERGVALALTLVIVMILAAIVLGMAHVTTGDVEIERLSRWDTTAQYLGQTAVEHQIYLFKGNKDYASPIPYTNFPVLPGETPGFGAFWYRTTWTCTVNCTGNPAARRWTIEGFGEVRQYDAGAATWQTLQQRTVRAQVEIAYVACSGVTNGCPSAVTLLRWEEVYP